jgi:hypothetical protein
MRYQLNPDARATPDVPDIATCPPSGVRPGASANQSFPSAPGGEMVRLKAAARAGPTIRPMSAAAASACGCVLALLERLADAAESAAAAAAHISSAAVRPDMALREAAHTKSTNHCCRRKLVVVTTSGTRVRTRVPHVLIIINKLLQISERRAPSDWRVEESAFCSCAFFGVFVCGSSIPVCGH